ncbi:hypothetical protein CUZ96_1356 [Enterococcus lactis]|nr:hypothetical protein [Enterococcus lactis]
MSLLTCFVLIWFCNHNCHLFIFIVLLFQAVNTFRKIEAAAQVKIYFFEGKLQPNAFFLLLASMQFF